jgi:hypothetical protein
MAAWTRPYHRRLRPFLNLGSVVLSVLVWLFVLLNIVVTGVGWRGALVYLAVGTVIQTFVVRNMTAGLYVGEAGVRLRWLLRRAVTVPWSEIHRVRAVDDSTFANRTLVIVTRDGTQLPTPIWRWRVSWPRRPFPAAAVALVPATFDALAADLDAMAAARNGRTSLQPG